MLKELRIQNYVLIKELEIEPESGLNTITGETGAGKSIMLGAIGLLLGQRADTKVLLEDESKCIIEGEFDLSSHKLQAIFEEEELDYENISIIRREISPSGKSRAFVNDTPVRLDTLKKLGENLIDIHSQHQTLLLQQANFQLKVVDAVAQNTSILDEYKTNYSTYTKLKQKLDKLKSQTESDKKDLDYQAFLLNELQEVNLVEGEEIELEKEQVFFENVERIKHGLSLVEQLLDNEEISINTQLSEACSTISKLSEFGENYSSLSERMSSVQLELSDISSEIASLNESVEYDQERAQYVAERHGLINKLFVKHGVESTSELLKIQEELTEKVETLNNSDEAIADLEKEFEVQTQKLNSIADRLSESRKAVFDYISTNICKSLSELGMPNAVLQIDAKQSDFVASGKDDIQFLFSANKGRTPEQLKNAASGGEFSRLMFSLKYLIADKTAMPTIIFDEIDTGISGEVAFKMGEMMKLMARNHQVFTITHLPQIAAKGSCQYFVHKIDGQDKTYSAVKKLSQNERVEEIAKMIGGDNPSQSALDSAHELLQ